MPTEPAEPPDWSRDLTFTPRVLLFTVILFLIFPVCVAVANNLLTSSGFFAWFYGPERVLLAQDTDQTDWRAELIRARLSLWTVPAAFPFWVASVAVLLRWTRLVAPADIGLTLRGAPRNLLLGVVVAVLLTPLVLAVNFAAVWFFKDVLQCPVQEHPLAFAGQHGLSVVEWLLLAFAVTVSAPVWEEILFRGALQRLFVEHAWASHFGVCAALLLALARRPPADVRFTDSLHLMLANLPVLFVAAMVPVYLIVYLLSKTNRDPAVFATALLFAATHSFAWPTPIALFVLGLGLGELAQRTRSLVAPIVLHSLFNAASYVLLVTGWGGS